MEQHSKPVCSLFSPKLGQLTAEVQPWGIRRWQKGLKERD